MTNLKELKRSAPLGDRKAQEECTRCGIALPCPCCGEKVEAIMNGQCVYHVRASCLIDSRFTPLSVWNTRPAPPVGRCGDCAHWYKEHCTSSGPCAAEETDAEFYCPNFEPKEGEKNG